MPDMRYSVVGSTGYEEDWRYCTTDTDGTLGFAVGAMFVRAAFKGNSKAKVCNNMYSYNLNNFPWMSYLFYSASCNYLISNEILQAEDMIQQVKTAFKKNLPKLKWMDDETRKAAVDKVSIINHL